MVNIERAVLIQNIVWYGSLLLPLVVGLLAGIASRRTSSDGVREPFIGAVIAFLVGSAGTYYGGELIISTIMGSGDIPYYLVAEAWHRMWYPLGSGVLVGVLLAILPLLPKRDAE